MGQTTSYLVSTHASFNVASIISTVEPSHVHHVLLTPWPLPSSKWETPPETDASITHGHLLNPVSLHGAQRVVGLWTYLWKEHMPQNMHDQGHRRGDTWGTKDSDSVTAESPEWN
jgi:hypothetical protein